MPVSPRSPLAERVSFPSADPGVKLEGRLALRRGGQQNQAKSSSSEAAADGSRTRSIGVVGVVGDASTSTPLPDLALVLLHPHAALGGSMADPICSAIYREARNNARFGAVAKFNARGAGGESGGALFGARGRMLLSSLLRSRQGSDDAAAVIRAVSSGEGIEIDGEPTFGDDEEEEEEEEEEEGEEEEEEGEGEEGARRGGGGGGSCSSSAAAETPKASLLPRRRRTKRRRKGYPNIARTFVVGYSWGSCVAAAAASALVVSASEEGDSSVEIGGLVAVSPPLGTAASLALGSGKCFSSSLSVVPRLPVLVAMGDRDLFCGEHAARSAVEGVNRARRSSRSNASSSFSSSSSSFEPLCLEVSKGLDHFWGAEDDPWSREEIGKLAKRVVAWVLEQEDARSLEVVRRKSL